MVESNLTVGKRIICRCGCSGLAVCGNMAAGMAAFCSRAFIGWFGCEGACFVNGIKASCRPWASCPSAFCQERTQCSSSWRAQPPAKQHSGGRNVASVQTLNLPVLSSWTRLTVRDKFLFCGGYPFLFSGHLLFYISRLCLNSLQY